MPPPVRRVTQKDIAEKLGMHRTTVCLALKNHPNIPESTRERVRRAAASLGYVPDPMLSALAAYRTRLKPASFHGTLGWLVNHDPSEGWRSIQPFEDYYQSAAEHAAKLGYQLDVFELQTRGMTARRMGGILRARNVAGLLICPQPRPNGELDFPWEDFSAVTFGYSLVKPALHCVAPSQYRAGLKTMEQLRKAGYRRIGFATTESHDQRVNHNCLAAYLAETFVHGGEIIVLPLTGKVYTPQQLRRWLKQNRVEAAIVSLDIWDRLQQSGLEFPDDLVVACPCLPTPRDRLAGVVEDSRLAGEVAVNFLVSMVQRGERGIPGTPQRVLIEGNWHAATTCRPLVREAAATAA